MFQLNALSTLNVVYDKLYSVIFVQCLYIALLLASGVEALLCCTALFVLIGLQLEQYWHLHTSIMCIPNIIQCG